VKIVAVFALMSILATGCTTIAPTASIVISVPGQSASPAASGAPSSASSIAPASVQPTVPVEPSQAATAQPATPTPAATKKPRPTGTPTLRAPNLVVSKLALGADPWLINTDTPLKVTVKNDGSADAASFYVGAQADTTDGQHSFQFAEISVASLAAGASTQVAFNANVSNAADYTITATADFYDDIAESNENDNTKQITATAVDLPNLYVEGSLTVTPPTAGSDIYEVAFTIGNNGSADAVDPVFYIFAYDSASTKYDLARHDLTHSVSAGATDPITNGVRFPASGGYTVYVLLDPDDTIVESDETDNEAYLAITVP
jgi:hypothetical protein